MEKRFIEQVLRFKAAILVATLVLTGVAGVYATRVQFDSSIEIWFLSDDEGLVAYKQFQERFAGDQVAVLGLFADDIFAPDSLKLLQKLTKLCEELPEAFRARSIINTNVPQMVGDDLEIASLVGAIPESPEALQKTKEMVLSNPLLLNNLVSADGRSSAILVELNPGANDYPSKISMHEGLKDIIQNHVPEGFKVHLSGAPVLDAAFFTLSQEDSTVLGPAAFLLIFICIMLVFRRPMAVVMPITVVVIALIWSFGVMGFLGLKIDIITVLLASVVMAVGVADSIHVLSDFFLERVEGLDNEAAIIKSVGNLLVPCLFTSATTVAGMLALLISDLGPVRQFGWLSALGVSFAFILSMTVGPILLLYVKSVPTNFRDKDGSSRMERVLQWLASDTQRYTKPIAALSLVVMAWSAWSVSQLEVGANPLLYYKEGSNVRVATEIIDEKLGGTTQIEFISEMEEGGLKNPKILKRLSALDNWVQSLEGITETISPLDGLTEIDRILNSPPAAPIEPGQPIPVATGGKLPTNQALAAQYFLLLEGEDDFEQSVQDNYSVGRMTARGKLVNAKELTEAIPTVVKHLKENYNDEELKIEVTGYGKLMGDMEAYLLHSQIKSFSVAFIVITLMMGILLRSLRLALFSMIPNFLPIFFGLALMSAVDIPLDPGTVMIGAIALGLVVDDTVHFLVRFRRYMTQGQELETAIALSVREAGRPIIITSVVLAVSFSVMVLANFTPNINFGLVTGWVILLAVLADLVILPTALRLFKVKF